MTIIISHKTKDSKIRADESYKWFMIFNHFLPEWFLVTSEQSGTGKSSSFINKY